MAMAMTMKLTKRRTITYTLNYWHKVARTHSAIVLLRPMKLNVSLCVFGVRSLLYAVRVCGAWCGCIRVSSIFTHISTAYNAIIITYISTFVRVKTSPSPSFTHFIHKVVGAASLHRRHSASTIRVAVAAAVAVVAVATASFTVCRLAPMFFGNSKLEDDEMKQKWKKQIDKTQHGNASNVFFFRLFVQLFA